MEKYVAPVSGDQRVAIAGKLAYLAKTEAESLPLQICVRLGYTVKV